MSSLILTPKIIFGKNAWISYIYHIILFLIINGPILSTTFTANGIGNHESSSLSQTISGVFSILSCSCFLMEILLLRTLTELGMNTYIRLSSLFFIIIGMSLSRLKLLSPDSYLISMAFALGKLIVPITEKSLGKDGITGNFQLLMHSTLICLSIFVIVWPFLPSSSFTALKSIKRHKFNKKRMALDRDVSRKMALYFGGVLPALIVYFISSLKHMIEELMNVHSHTQSVTAFLRFEVWGYSLLIWGAVVTLTLHNNLPDGGAELWKRSAFVSFLIGFGTCFIAPSFMLSTSRNEILTISNKNILQFESFRSILASQGSSRVGLFGMMTAIVVLLRLTAPKRSNAKGTFVFSSASNKGDLLLLGFILTVGNHFAGYHIAVYIFCCVMFATALKYGKFIEHKEYSCIFLGFFTIFALGYMVNASMNQTHLLSLLGGTMFLSLSVMGRLLQRRRNIETRSFANVSIFLAWCAFTVGIHCEFGIASIGVFTEHSYILGYPVSV